MTASKSTSHSEESMSDSSVDYERLGRELLIARLEIEAIEIRDLYFEVARSVKNGNDLGESELRKLEEADRLTRDLVQIVE